jgi:hypothetical protein
MSAVMDATIIVALITAGATITAGAVTFALTKAKEREAEWRSQKLAHYKEFMAAANLMVVKEPPDADRVRFANASNNIYLVGAPPVLVALRAFLDETATSNPDFDPDRHDDLLTALLLAIRKDLGVEPQPPSTFRFKMWSARPRS